MHIFIIFLRNRFLANKADENETFDLEDEELRLKKRRTNYKAKRSRAKNAKNGFLFLLLVKPNGILPTDKVEKRTSVFNSRLRWLAH